jgi:hypothetical protein
MPMENLGKVEPLGKYKRSLVVKVPNFIVPPGTPESAFMAVIAIASIIFGRRKRYFRPGGKEHRQSPVLITAGRLSFLNLEWDFGF